MRNKILSLTLILVNLAMLFYAVQLMYYYNFKPDVLFAFMLPGWLLFTYVFVALWGIIVDVKLFANKLSVKKALLLDLAPKLLLFFVEGFLF